ncbi:oleate hydratase [Companilactobacillus sp. HBUAS56257]
MFLSQITLFSIYNQYESFIQPMVKFLGDKGVQFTYNTHVENVA